MLFYITLNPKNERSHMASNPRDTYTEIVGSIPNYTVANACSLGWYQRQDYAFMF